jgi:hypothetical protein
VVEADMANATAADDRSVDGSASIEILVKQKERAEARKQQRAAKNLDLEKPNAADELLL